MIKNRCPYPALAILWLAALPGVVTAGVRGGLVREAAESIIRTFGKEATTGGVDRLARRLETLAARHGTDALTTARRLGPHGVQLMEDAGEHGAVVARLLARHGEPAVALVSSRGSLALVARYGDGAAQALLKHPGVAEPLIEALGKPGAKALNAIGTRGGRRLVQMLHDGSLAAIGHTGELLAVVERLGDRALAFVWRHKGALTMAAALTAFLADPEAFLNGARDIGQVVAQDAIAPVVAAPALAAREAVRHTNWTVVAMVLGGAIVLWAAGRRTRGRRSEHPPR